MLEPPSFLGFDIGLTRRCKLISGGRHEIICPPQTRAASSIESVRQWRDLGLSLEEIVTRRCNLGEGVLLKEAMPNPFSAIGDDSEQAVIQVLHVENPEERAKAHQEFEARRKRGEPGIVVYKHETALNIPGMQSEIKTIQNELQLEYASVIERLEAKKLELEKRITKAKLIQEKLNQKPKS